jgi:hypothetical protein
MLVAVWVSIAGLSVIGKKRIDPQMAQIAQIFFVIE